MYDIVPKVYFPIRRSAFVSKAVEEFNWLQSVESKIVDNAPNTNISWAVYHISQVPRQYIIPAVSVLLPLFPNDSKSVSMIRHAMDVIWKVVQVFNPGQIPVITLDQPLYTIAKQIQYFSPASNEEDKYVILLGGLHIEKASLYMIGDCLEQGSAKCGPHSKF